MSDDADEVRALAHAFARTLEHLREFRGVSYVGSAPTPIGEHPEHAGELGGDDRADESPAQQAPAEVSATTPAPGQVEAPVPDGFTPQQQGPETRHRPEQDRRRHSPPARPMPGSPPQQTERNRSPQQSTYSHGNPQSPAPVNRSGSARPDSSPASSKPAARGSASAKQWPAAKKLAYLRERNVGDCQRCPLARTRRNIVFGVGNPEADVMFIGEAPGAEEDRRGEPFVGAAGRRLDQWIERLGMRRADVYIANVLKCRPPGNRDPQSAEIERCSPFLHAQIRAIEPKVLIALGRFAGCLLLQRDLKLWEMRGKAHSYREPKSGVELPLFVTYHPAYVLRSEQRPRPSSPGQGRPDRGGAIKSEDEKVLADLARAVSLVRGRA